MRSFRHRRGRIIFEIVGALLIASIAAERWVDGRSISGLIAAAALSLYALYRAVLLFARNPALAYGERGVQVGRLFRISNYQWDQVRDIRESVWTRPYIPFMHWLPKERQYIELQTQSETVKVRPDMMELPSEGVKQVIAGLRAAQVAALGERGAATARLGAKPAGQPYVPPSGVQAERLQRLGLGTGGPQEDENPVEGWVAATPRQVNTPSHPVFGRKLS
jgi:hypothetical protein